MSNKNIKTGLKSNQNLQKKSLKESENFSVTTAAEFFKNKLEEAQAKKNEIRSNLKVEETSQIENGTIYTQNIINKKQYISSNEVDEENDGFGERDNSDLDNLEEGKSSSAGIEEEKEQTDLEIENDNSNTEKSILNKEKLKFKRLMKMLAEFKFFAIRNPSVQPGMFDKEQQNSGKEDENFFKLDKSFDGLSKNVSMVAQIEDSMEEGKKIKQELGEIKPSKSLGFADNIIRGGGEGLGM